MLGAYVAPVTSVAAHDVGESASAHRYQRALVVRFPDPEADRHVPTAAVRVWPTCAVPVTVGLLMASGGATTGSSMPPAPPKYGEESSSASCVAAGGSLSMRKSWVGSWLNQVSPTRLGIVRSPVISSWIIAERYGPGSTEVSATYSGLVGANRSSSRI